MADESGEKTEEPTSKKIDDSRKKGQVWKSKDMTGVGVFLGGLGALKVSWDFIERRFAELFQFSFDQLTHPTDLALATNMLMLNGLTSIVVLTLPVAATAGILALLLDFLQVGPLFSAETLMPKLDKLNPMSGLKNMFSKKSLVELLKSSTKISIAAYVVYGVVKNALGMVLESVRGTPQQLLAVLGELVYRVCVRVGLLFVLFAIFDIWWQRRSFYKDLMMTKEEVKKEYKESEGDPHHKAKRRELHQEILEGAQMEAVRDADVVVTNPDHVAVALQYDKEKDTAPRVLAKGIDFKAEKIKAVAREFDVPTLRNVPLAHALLRIEVGEEIPEELYDAVAEVLNFVYGLQKGIGS